MDVVEVKYSTQGFQRNSMFQTNVLYQLCKQSVSEALGGEISQAIFCTMYPTRVMREPRGTRGSGYKAGDT